MQLNESDAYAALGAEGFDRLAAAFYRRVKADDLLGPMYPENDWEGAEARLAGFLRFRFGGDQTYIEQRGHPRLRMRHHPFPIGPAARNRWVSLMDQALDDIQAPEAARRVLAPFFAQTATFMMNRVDDPPGTCPAGIPDDPR